MSVCTVVMPESMFSVGLMHFLSHSPLDCFPFFPSLEVKGDTTGSEVRQSERHQGAGKINLSLSRKAVWPAEVLGHDRGYNRTILVVGY